MGDWPHDKVVYLTLTVADQTPKKLKSKSISIDKLAPKASLSNKQSHNLKPTRQSLVACLQPSQLWPHELIAGLHEGKSWVRSRLAARLLGTETEPRRPWHGLSLEPSNKPVFWEALQLTRPSITDKKNKPSVAWEQPLLAGGSPLYCQFDKARRLSENDRTFAETVIRRLKRGSTGFGLS